MKIVVTSHFFWPSIGGIEQVSGILATEWAALGHDVTVVTTTEGTGADHYGFRVLRNPASSDLMACFRQCEIVFQSNISLRTLWPAVVARRPMVITYHTWVTRVDGRRGWRDYLKLACSRIAARRLAVSVDLARSISSDCETIPNPYQDDVFRRLPSAKRDRDLVFLGRLVSDKGIDLCLDALALLKQRGLTPSLTIVGSGPEEARLREQSNRQGLQEQVRFAGAVTGASLTELLNEHRLIVVPSRWREPFGLVALEGIACGCAAIGSTGGGLPDAIGPCGVTFRSEDTVSLADELEKLLRNPARIDELQSNASDHLAKHSRRTVAKKYLDVFEQVLQLRG